MTSHLATVDYSLPYDRAIEASRSKWARDDIRVRRFSRDRKNGKREVSFELIRRTPGLSLQEEIEEMSRAGLRPATLIEGLAFRRAFPTEDAMSPIVLLGSTAAVGFFRKKKLAPFFAISTQNKSCIFLTSLTVDFDYDVRFLGVKE